MRLLLFVLLVCLSAAAESRFEAGMERYRAGEYAAAFEAFTEAYEASEDEDAAYMIAKMYDAGEGVAPDRRRADLWYRRAARHYFSAAADSSLHRENKRLLSAYRELDPVEDNETAETIRKIVVSDFGLKTFHENYLLPFGYRNGAAYDSYVPSDHYTNIEAQLQLSFRLDFLPNLLGLKETYTAAYTQRSFWQVYAASAPFRETNYQPEFFVTFPVAAYKLPVKALSVGIAHQSNGQGNVSGQAISDANITNQAAIAPYLRNRSRSWNYFWSELLFQTGSLFTELKLWYRLKEHREDDDNPDLTDYLGYGSLRFELPYGKSMTTLLLRQNFATGKGAQELTWSYPLLAQRENVFWYFKAFTGYGESLIDYDTYITKLSIGFSFSR